MTDHTVHVWLTPQTITVAQQPDGTWLATGIYKGAPVEARSQSEASARRIWIKKTRRMDHPPHPAERNES
jgi:hypothetical protein